MFQEFPKLTRFSHAWTVSEKLDGSNGQVLIVSHFNPDALPMASFTDFILDTIEGEGGPFNVYAGSRNRLLQPHKSADHMGFAAFVKERAASFVELLGEGRHFGEWFGQGSNKRTYNTNPKQFALFNLGRWRDQPLPDRVTTVPLLYEGRVENFVLFDHILADLKREGSRIGGYDNPEGIVMFHAPSKTLFKRTYDYDEAGKWAENQARRA